jgi:MFS family permease
VTSTTHQTPAANENQPGAWLAVILLCVLMAVSYVDRYILALLADPVASDLSLSDEQLGILLGFGFAALYSIAGIPLAFLLDRHDRIRIIFFAVCFWSLATTASAFSGDFWTLLFWRAGVAAGEAVLLPGGISLIADYFIKSRRSRPTALFTATAPLMAGGAFIVGGFAYSAAQAIHDAGVSFEVWRITLVLVGLPGFFVALLFYLSLRDPGRQQVTAELAVTAVSAPPSGLVSHVMRNLSFYGLFWIGLGLGSAIAVAVVSWTSTLLTRGYGMDVAEAGFAFGLVILPSGFLGTFLWSELAIRLTARGARSGPVLSFMVAVSVLTIFAGSLAFAPSPAFVLGSVMLTMLGSGGLLVLPAMCVHLAVPMGMRARVTALNVFASNIVGMTLGPLAIAMLARFWPDEPRALGLAIATFSAGAGLVALSCLWMSRPGFTRLAH